MPTVNGDEAIARIKKHYPQVTVDLTQEGISNRRGVVWICERRSVPDCRQCGSCTRVITVMRSVQGFIKNKTNKVAKVRSISNIHKTIS